MPVISKFYGILIKIYFSDHSPAHFHAIYAEYNGVFNIETLEMIEGDLPNKAILLVKEWAKLYQSELLDIWNSQLMKKLPPLE